ncbi:MAG TPA: hypothetical protein DEA96_11085 [Leptospiraceae bacterium]|nr:hypothetical protein [Spirochaetaceae bacterium]HBS05503.1 hypothetical protein [Leptospiraceae bacterium]|tara:strand:+ start:28123 stop:29115 length:993 start_codon:yes stop_codon:yes gene_type:complete
MPRKILLLALSFLSLSCLSFKVDTEYRKQPDRLIETYETREFWMNRFQSQAQLGSDETITITIRSQSVYRLIHFETYLQEGEAIRSVMRIKEGGYKTREHVFFDWSHSQNVDGIGQYATINLFMALPTAGLSLVVMTLDLASLPLRTLDYRYSRKRSRPIWQRFEEEDRIVEDVLECPAFKVKILNGRGIISRSLLSEAQWHSYQECELHGESYVFFLDLAQLEQPGRTNPQWLKNLAAHRQKEIRQELRSALLDGLELLKDRNHFGPHRHSLTRFCAMLSSSVHFLDSSPKGSLKEPLDKLCAGESRGPRYESELKVPVVEMLRILDEE